MKKATYKKGFTLVEVMLAIGLFSVAIALLGLLGGAVGSVSDVVQRTRATSAASSLNAELQKLSRRPATDFSSNELFFDGMLRALSSKGVVQLFVYQRIVGNNESDLETVIAAADSDAQRLGFDSLNAQDFKTRSRGSLFRVIISAASSNSKDFMNKSNDGIPNVYTYQIGRNNISIFKLVGSANSTTYTEGYLALNVRFYVEMMPSVKGAWDINKTFQPSALVHNYNTVIVR